MDNVKKIIKDLNKLANPKDSALLSRFFKTGPGQYGEGDIFLGVKVPEQRKLALKYSSASFKELQVLLNSGIHEQRLVALLVLVEKYNNSVTKEQYREIFEFYKKNFKAINNWDLVDLTTHKIFGHYLYNYCSPAEIEDIFSKLATSKNLWQRRIAIVATLYFIRRGSCREIFWLVKKLKNDKHDLIHKALGWMLREAGKQVSLKKLLIFLDKYAHQLPRTTLRYAIERLPEVQRKAYLINSRLSK